MSLTREDLRQLQHARDTLRNNPPTTRLSATYTLNTGTGTGTGSRVQRALSIHAPTFCDAVDVLEEAMTHLPDVCVWREHRSLAWHDGDIPTWEPSCQDEDPPHTRQTFHTAREGEFRFCPRCGGDIIWHDSTTEKHP